MNSPICDFVRHYAEEKNVRAHMPGHKGEARIGVEAYDITEISGADVLYHGDGIIRESERNAAELFGTAKTLYSTEGSSLAIRAMVYLVKLYAAEKGEKASILAGRNAHKTFVSAAALLDVDVEWIFPENGSYISCPITPQCLEKLLSSKDKMPTAVYITSPDYLGNLADVRGLSEVCHRYGTRLVVDNAHGAYLNFLPENQHPMQLGAEMCCDSAHKTLPALTGSAYLHISQNADRFFAENAEKAMMLFASTSPSYIIMQSLDALNPYLASNFPRELAEKAALVTELKNRLSACGYVLCGDEAMKLTLDCGAYGYTGEELDFILRQQGIYCEFSDPDYLVMMFSAQNTDEELQKISEALTNIPRRDALEGLRIKLSVPEQAVTPHDALMSASHTVPAALSEGKILASLTVSCPPAIPIVSCGEKIDADAVKLFEYYGIEKVEVL